MADLYHLTSDYQWHLERLRTLRNAGAPAAVIVQTERKLHEARQQLQTAWLNHQPRR